MDAPKKRGRPKKNQEEVKTEEVQEDYVEVVGTPGAVSLAESFVPLQSEPLQVEDIKHVIRTLNWFGEFKEGSQSKEVIEDHLRQNYFSQGYSLYSVQHLSDVRDEGGKPFGSILLYILVK